MKEAFARRVLLLLALTAYHAFAQQDSIKRAAQVPDTSDSRRPLEKALAGAEPAGADFLTVCNSDVFRYFGLDEYDTDLKKAMFMKTPEYETLLDSLKTLKKRILAGRWYVDVRECPPGGYSAMAWTLTDYDVKSQGFDMILGINAGSPLVGLVYPRGSFGDFLFTSFPTNQVAADPVVYGSDAREERLFLPMSEESGLAVETGGTNIKVYVVFSVTDVKEVSCLSAVGMVSQKLLSTESVRIIIGNVSTGEVYFDRRY